jgi:sortase B
LKKPKARAETASSKKKKSYSGLSVGKVSKTVVLILAVVVFGTVTLVAGMAVLASISDHRDSVAENEYLRDIAAAVVVETESDGFEAETLSALEVEMRSINPDFVGWISIEGTRVDYPVVRGTDNVEYLTTTFQGEYNVNGTLFMDFRNLCDISVLPHIIIYGHNTEQGGMFTDLHKFLSDDFLAENNVIALQVGDEVLEYTIFDVRLTDVNDYAYFLDFGAYRAFQDFADRVDAPLRALQVITLSTCTNCSNPDARLVVQGYR